MTYEAVVSKIYVRPLPGADRLQIGTCGQYQVVVGIDVRDGDLGVFFETDGQLSQSFCEANDLIRRVDPDGNKCGGMFEENRRVKSIKLRGVRSDGFWTSIKSLEYTGADLGVLYPGQQFSELNGHLICSKYETASTIRAKKTNSQKRKFMNLMFREHIETGHYKRCAHLIPADSLIIVTEKLHGTSFRYGHVLTEVPVELNRLTASIYWVLDFCSVLICGRSLALPTVKKWSLVHGSRRVILPADIEDVRSDIYRYTAFSNILLRKGEVLYGEIVGFDENGQSIMPIHSMERSKDALRVFPKSNGRMVYKYGLEQGSSKAYVYRITQVNEDGDVVELSWYAVRQRCRELGLETVPVLEVFHYSGDIDSQYELSHTVNSLTESGDSPLVSTLDVDTLREGVVVRHESIHGVDWLKNKSFAFGVLEGYQKDNDSVVDTEEAS